MTRKELTCKICDLLEEDCLEISDYKIQLYILDILEELKFCKITYKSINDISLHEIKITEKDFNGNRIEHFVLTVHVIYNGNKSHTIRI